MNYSFKPGKSVAGLSADAVGNELERIQRKHGELTTKGVVDESRPEEAVFHPHFEWDDPKAAELYREHQARQIVHSVVIETSETEAKPQAFVSVETVSEEEVRHVYKPVEAVAADPDLREKHVRALKSRLNNMRRELSAFEEFASVCAAIDAVA